MSADKVGKKAFNDDALLIRQLTAPRKAGKKPCNDYRNGHAWRVCVCGVPRDQHKFTGPTPGPWSLEDEGHLDHEGKIWVTDARGLCVVDIEVETDATIGPDEAEYNAHLISAAPELLAALKEVVALSDRKHDAWDKAHAAIAKAEGGK